MLYTGGIAQRRASAIYLPGAKDPAMARSMGLIPTRTFDEAVAQAAKYVGRQPKMLVLPEYLLKVPAHLYARAA
jgi:hypothetical protein